MNQCTRKGKLRPLINPEGLPLTPDKLRELSALDVTDEKATEIIHSIRLLCKILYEFSNSQKIRYIGIETHNLINENTQNLAA